MEFYVIPPLSNLQLMEKGQRIFVLAQLWLRSEEYRTFILQQKQQGKWITLDNGVGDHDFVDQDTLLKITKELHPNEVIALDVLYNREATLYNLNRFAELLRSDKDLDDVEIFAVPQGGNHKDWLDCYKSMLLHPKVNTIGLSKIGVPFAYNTGSNDTGIMEGRHLCYDELMELGLIQKPIHCLGAGDPREFLKYINNPLMRSTDSCFTVWSAMNQIDWYTGNFERVPTPKDYFDREITEEQLKLVDSNIDFLKKVLYTAN